MRSSVSLNRLEVFVALAESRSFRECARHMRRTQPSISRQIRELEDELGRTLFVRDPHRVELTDEGRNLLARVRTPVQMILRAVGESAAREDVLVGALKFGTLTEVGQSVFFGFVLEFCRKHPGVIPDIRYQEERVIREQLRKGELDFGVVSHAFENETLRSHRLLTERIVLVGRPDLRFSDMKKERLPMVGYRMEDPLIELFEKKFCRKRQLSCATVCHVNSHQSMIEALLDLDVFAFMPSLSARKQLASGELRTVPGFEVEQTLFLGYAAQTHENAIRKAFREHVIRSCRRLKP